MSKSLYFTRLNKNGPEPFDYLAYAKSDLSTGSQQGRINALGHAKRATHLTVEQLMYAWGLQKAYGRTRFPTKLAILKELGAFPIKMITDLNHTRNLMEHKFEDVREDDVSKFVEITEMFLLLIYPYFKCIVKGVYVGLVDDDRCLEWTVDHEEAKVSIYEVEAPLWIDSALGRVHCNVGDENSRSLLETFQITRASSRRWLPYLDLFVYCTKRAAIRLESLDSRNGRVYESHHSIVTLDL